MKTQTSHTTPIDNPGYSGVYQQQGRMITDADWNALTDLEKQRLVNALRDAIASGAPREGGLALADTDDGIVIEPGTLYVDGLPAHLSGDEPIPLNDQPDCPSLAELPADEAVVLFADVWEREVTALEDPALMDPALHGADTTTRSRTLLQVKWKPFAGETPLNETPLDEWKAPADRGNAPLKLALRKIVVGDDPCDPCASEMDLDERIGNYLFRVEVHDVFEEDSARYLTLKWSRDNGAEAHEADNVPPGFNRGDWVWEFYDTDSENSAGLYFPAGHSVRRGRLRTAFDIPDETDHPTTFVRQWDGYLVVNVDTHELVEGRDRGTELSTDGSSDAHGWTRLKDGVLTLNGELVEFELEYAKREFLPGDYWQAAVRETQYSSGDYVLGSDESGEPPRGIQHRYLPLAYLDSDGTLSKHSDKERRRFSFPPLTDLNATDVGFTEKCDNLFHNAKNVQQALDALCEIGAEDIAYRPLKECLEKAETPLNKLSGHLPDNEATVKEVLDTLLCHLSSDALPHNIEPCRLEGGHTLREHLKLKKEPYATGDILNRILCETTAQRIPLDPRAELCESLQREEVQTVQEALNALCRRDTGGGCARVVEPGQLETVLKELIRSEAEHIWLCLKPGKHTWPDNLNLLTKHCRICGGGKHSTVLAAPKATRVTFDAESIILRDLTIDTPATLGLSGISIDLSHTLVKRSKENKSPLVHFDGQKRPDGKLTVEHSQLHTRRDFVCANFTHLHGRLRIESCELIGISKYHPYESGSEEIQERPVTRKLADSLTDSEWSLTAGKAPDDHPEQRSHVSLKDNIISQWQSFVYGPMTTSSSRLYAVAPHSIYLDGNMLGQGSTFTAQTIQINNNLLSPPTKSHPTIGDLILLGNRLSALGNFSDIQSPSITVLARDAYTDNDPILKSSGN